MQPKRAVGFAHGKAPFTSAPQASCAGLLGVAKEIASEAEWYATPRWDGFAGPNPLEVWLAKLQQRSSSIKIKKADLK